MNKRILLVLVLALALVVPALSVAAAPAAPGPVSGYQVVISSQQNYGDGGWAGWSCPAGKVVLSGGFKATGPVEVSAPGTPGSVWPHWTFGASEYGWVVRDLPDGASNTIFIYVVCADPPPGYQVVKSSALNYADGGFAGWSCPTNKVVTGGGFELPGSSAAASVPGTPGSVWTHYTFGANEYGWVVGADADGASSPGSYVYAVCTDPLDGYAVGTSPAMGFGDGGYAGWSTPAGTAVLGGGWLGTDSVRTSAPGTPGSVWPHHTFGASDYGWVLSDAPNGAGQTMTVYYIAGTWPPPPPTINVSTSDAVICTGETTDVFIDLANVVDLYGYQFEVSYDQSKASASGAFLNSFFDVNNNGFVPSGWNAACASGTCKFSKSEVAPDPAVTGSGQVAKITLTAGATPGAFSMVIGNDTLSDIDGAPLAHTLGAPLPITVCGYATVTGFITMQGRPGNNVNAGMVSLVEQAPINFTPPGVASVPFSASNGAYTIPNVPYMAGGSSYKIVAEHGLYLDNSEVFNVTGNATKSTRLWGGDANNDGDVKIGDLSCIGGSFGGPVAGSCAGGSSDINADGIINIQDLSLTGGNFFKCGAQPWDWLLGTPLLCP